MAKEESVACMKNPANVCSPAKKKPRLMGTWRGLVIEVQRAEEHCAMVPAWRP